MGIVYYFMRHDNIIDALETKCPYPEVLNEENIPRDDTLIVYFRADYDGHRWWNTIWPKQDELATLEIRKEIDAVYAELISKHVFSDLDSLRSFCYSFSCYKDNVDQYDFYLESKHCWYWLHCITRNKDYNLYLHAYPNACKKLKVYFNFLDAIEIENPVCKIETQIAFLRAHFPELSDGEAISIVFRWQFRFIPTETTSANETSVRR